MVALALAVSPRPAPAAPQKTPLDIEADRLDFDRKAGVARFEGSVRAKQGDFSLRCEHLVATYATGGELRTLTMDGGVALTAEGVSARSETAQFDARTGELVLLGQPELFRGQDHLTGERIRLWPETGRVLVEKARGSVLLPRLRPVLPTGAEAAPAPPNAAHAP